MDGEFYKKWWWIPLVLSTAALITSYIAFQKVLSIL